MPRLDTLPQFREAARVQALLDALRAEVDALRADAAALALQETLDGAEGTHLDRWGRIIGWRRGGLSDAVYRRVLQAVLLARRSEGNVSRIVEAATVLAGFDAEYSQRWRAAYRLTFDTSGGAAFDTELAEVLASILAAMAPAGVASTAVEGRGFRFDTGRLDTDTMGRRL